jgi:ABC-2 type transport system permease protein
MRDLMLLERPGRTTPDVLGLVPLEASVAWTARDWLTMASRCVRLSARNIEALVMSLAMPVMVMLLFVYLFGGAINTGTRYVTYVVPGVLVLCAAYGSATTAVAVSQDMTTGIVDRFRSMDVSGAAVLAGHVVASVVRNIASTVLVLGVALLIGFRPHLGVSSALAATGVLLVFSLAISWVAATLGLLAGSPEAAAGFTLGLGFLPYPSSAFVRIATMPHWLQGLARHQPVTPVVQSLRGFLLGTPVGSNAWTALAWCLGLVLVAVVVSRTVFGRRTA